MNKIPQKIVKMVEERNKLDKEIDKFFREEIGDDVFYDTKYAEIVNANQVSGIEQGRSNCKEYCDQVMYGEDTGCGNYFWETEVNGKFLGVHYDF